jgi:hypothetical protein
VWELASQSAMASASESRWALGLGSKSQSPRVWELASRSLCESAFGSAMAWVLASRRACESES